MNTHKTYRAALILGASPLHRLTAAVGVASLGLFGATIYLGMTLALFLCSA